MKVKDIIVTPITSCSAKTDVGAARELMRFKRFSALPVVKIDNGKPKIIGIISYYDLAGVYDDNINVQQIMSTDVKAIHPEASIQEAAQLMVEKGIHHLVVQDEHIQGIISSFDFVKIVAEQRLAESMNS